MARYVAGAIPDAISGQPGSEVGPGDADERGETVGLGPAHSAPQSGQVVVAPAWLPRKA